ncbi:MAG: phosphate acyltransferase [Porticoccus sp.]|nr:phosphate acyltransferase [Porticoccus sp.]
MRLAVDAMGGDSGVSVTIPASLFFLKNNPSVFISFYGDSTEIKAQLSDYSDILKAVSDRFDVVHCKSEVSIKEKPSYSIRNKKNTSMWCAIESLSNNINSACVSSGNTGSLMAISLQKIGCIKGISRPAICSKIPTSNSSLNGHTYLLDLGANVECSAKKLHQFSLMASRMISVIHHIDLPSVALLNIGVEETKGHEELWNAAKLLKADKNINYVGFIEGNSIFKDEVNIVVCDGFTGNISIKTMEGFAELSHQYLNNELSLSFFGKLGKLIANAPLKKFYKKLDPSQYNGASFLGLRKVVVKSHGNSSIDGFYAALKSAMIEVKLSLPDRIEQIFIEHVEFAED